LGNLITTSAQSAGLAAESEKQKHDITVDVDAGLGDRFGNAANGRLRLDG
jgi:hypothetical protein